MKIDEQARLVLKRSLTEDAVLLTFESPRLSAAIPGQFTMARVLAPELLLRRPYSFCHLDPEGGRFTLLVKAVGRGTRRLAELPVGAEVFCLGPLGTPFRLPSREPSAHLPLGAALSPDGRGGGVPATRKEMSPQRPIQEETRIVMVAGGVGIAPFVGLSDLLAREGRRATVLLGGRRGADLYLREDFERLGMTVHCTTEDGSYGERGLVTSLLARAVSNGAPVALYSCGPSGMLRAVAAWGAERGIPHQVSIERRMGCGMGCCLGCVVFTREGSHEGEYHRGCTEGPVFDAARICWDKDPHPL